MKDIHPDFYTGQGRASWGPRGRHDVGKQPDREALQVSLLYMQTAVNAYAAQVPAVRANPNIYPKAPTPSAEEIECAVLAEAQCGEVLSTTLSR